LFFSSLLLPPSSTLFPYTTLFRSSGGDGISDVAGTDGAEQLAFLTGVSGDGDGQISQLGCTGFSLGRLLGSDLFQLSATRFEGLDVGGSGRSCLTERQQEIASIARLHGDLVAQAAQIRDLFEQDNFHCDDLFEFNLGCSGRHHRADRSAACVSENRTDCLQMPKT